MTTEQENKIANDWLLNYHDKKESYDNMVNNFNVLGAMTYEGLIMGQGTTGNPCVNKAMSLIKIDEYKKWLEVIDLVESTLSPKMKTFLRVWQNAERDAKSEGGRPGWYAQASNEYAKWFEKEYGGYCLPSRDVLKSWRIDLINVTVRVAIRNKLL